MRKDSRRFVAALGLSLAANLPVARAKGDGVPVDRVSPVALASPAIRAEVEEKGFFQNSTRTIPSISSIQECLNAAVTDAEDSGYENTTYCIGRNQKRIAVIETTIEPRNGNGQSKRQAHPVFTQLSPELPQGNARTAEAAKVAEPSKPGQHCPTPESHSEFTEEQLEMLAISPRNGPFRLDVGYTSRNSGQDFFTTVSETQSKSRWDTVGQCIGGAKLTASGSDVTNHNLLFTCFNRTGNPVVHGENRQSGLTVSLSAANPANGEPKFWGKVAECDAAVEDSRIVTRKLGIKPLAPGQP